MSTHRVTTTDGKRCESCGHPIVTATLQPSEYIHDVPISQWDEVQEGDTYHDN